MACWIGVHGMRLGGEVFWEHTGLHKHLSGVGAVRLIGSMHICSEY